MLDTNRLLADTLDQQADLYQHHLQQQSLLPQRTRELRSEVTSEGADTYNVNDSMDSGKLFVTLAKK